LKGDGLCQVSTQSRSGFPEVGYTNRNGSGVQAFANILGQRNNLIIVLLKCQWASRK
jgi:hypothetical protein